LDEARTSEKLKNPSRLSLTMSKNILFRAVIEVLGKPKKHIENSLKNYITNLKKEEQYEVVNEEYADIKKQEEQDLWAAFAEIEVKTSKINDLIAFCFNYMPSTIEIIEPSELKLSRSDVSNFLNDLQARLHHVDMVAKQVKMENDYLTKNMGGLLKNYVLVLLSKSNLTSDQLSKLTGVNKDRLEDFLDQLIDEGKINLKGGIYYTKQ